MYPGQHSVSRPQQVAVIMAETGGTVTYAELEARTNRLAHLLRASGLRRLDHYSIFMENKARYVESCGAGERTGLYFTCVNSHLTPDELAYILNNSDSKVLTTSKATRNVMNRLVGICSTRRVRPGGRRVSCDPCRSSHHLSRSPCPISWRSFGSTAKAWSIYRLRRSTILHLSWALTSAFALMSV